MFQILALASARVVGILLLLTLLIRVVVVVVVVSRVTSIRGSRVGEDSVIDSTLCSSQDPNEKDNNTTIQHLYREKEWSESNMCPSCTSPPKKQQQSDYFFRVIEEQRKRQEKNKKKKEQQNTTPIDQ